ncbi:MAG: hypothetical protein Q7U34_12895, partial [Anaerolineales bacterium]|nr:hypothetical protein [Anaerolineales bacterium]
MYAQIAVNVPTVTGVFDYALPPELEGKVGAGHLVSVPFGKQTVQGVVFRLVSEPSVPETKNIIALLDPQPVLTGTQIALAQWLAETTLSPLAACIGLMLPGGLAKQADVQYSVISNQFSVEGLGEAQKRLLKLLKERGPLRGRQIDRHFSRVDWRKTAQYLLRSGVLQSQSILPPISVRPKFVRTAQLAVTPETAEAALPDLGKTEATLQRRQAALRFLMHEPEVVNVAWVYAESGCNLTDLQELAERELIVLRETEIWRDPLQRIENRGVESSEVTLTPAQQTAISEIMQAFALQPTASQSTNLPFLLHGVTGSGKTEIYIRAAREAIRRGKQAIIL